jgi:hypothetical protein
MARSLERGELVDDFRIKPVQPVWCDVPSPSRLSPSKYSETGSDPGSGSAFNSALSPKTAGDRPVAEQSDPNVARP